MSLKNTLRQFSQRIVPRGIRNWARSPSTSLQYVRHRLAYACGRTAAVELRDGWKLECHPASRRVFDVFRSDPIQAAEFAAFRMNCPPGMRLLDVGAHYGFFALAALRYGSPDAQVVCVEPSPAAVAILNTNLAINRVHSAVRVINCALGDAEGEMSMLTTGPLGCDYFVVSAHERPDTVMIPQRSLDALLQELEFAPTHIKLDVESYEYEILHAAQDVLRRLRPVLFLELHGTMLRRRGLQPKRVLETLRACGYQQFLLDGSPISDEGIANAGYDCRLIVRGAAA